jgi:hypothetical protein
MPPQKRPFSELSMDGAEAFSILEAGEYADLLPAASKCSKQTHCELLESSESSASRSLEHVSSIFIPSAADETLQSIGQDDWENLVSSFFRILVPSCSTPFANFFVPIFIRPWCLKVR